MHEFVCVIVLTKIYGMAEVVVSEILRYVQNNFSKFPTANLITLVGFYRDEKVFAAKKLLFSYVESVKEKPTNVPRLVKRQGDNRRKMDCEDFIDENDANVCFG